MRKVSQNTVRYDCVCVFVGGTGGGSRACGAPGIPLLASNPLSLSGNFLIVYYTRLLRKKSKRYGGSISPA